MNRPLLLVLPLLVLLWFNTSPCTAQCDSISAEGYIENPTKAPEFVSEQQDCLITRLHYPKAAKDSNIQGVVRLKLAISKDGQLTGIKVVKPLGGGCTEELIKVVKEESSWKPGECNGRPVNAYLNLSEIFPLPYKNSDGVHMVSLSAAPSYTQDASTNLQYPDEAQRHNVKGTVTLRFKVDTSGIVSNIEVLSGLSYGCTEAAIRYVQQLHWRPAYLRKDPIPALVNMNVKFPPSEQ